MSDMGMEAVQLWLTWGWIESEPGIYRFDDFDEIISLATDAGLKILLSTIAEVQPFWIHRVEPDAYMVTSLGERVSSSTREENNTGITPGGCWDHPGVASRMESFLAATAEHYAPLKALIGWDAWNETRWCVHADGFCCYCSNTLGRFREWLKSRHGGIEELNEAWKRRYSSWEDVMPGKLPHRPFTEMMEFLRFLSWRASDHMAFRYRALRSKDPDHFVSAHNVYHSPVDWGTTTEQPLCRGNDWRHVDELDGFGISYFPSIMGYDETDLSWRLESHRSANRGKPMWMSELQGGGSLGLRQVPGTPAKLQQRWIWNGISRGVKGVIFWCWRDEVFGPEAAGYGLIGGDGHSRDRLVALKALATVIGKNRELLQGYAPDPARVGILFEPDNTFLDWSLHGPLGPAPPVVGDTAPAANAHQQHWLAAPASSSRHKAASHAVGGTKGYLRALQRLNTPVDVVESSTLEQIEELEVLLMPFSPVVSEKAVERIATWVRSGGTLLCEAETGSYTSSGFYRYPYERPLHRALGLGEIRKRKPTESWLELKALGGGVRLRPDLWIQHAPGDGMEILAGTADEAVIFRKQLGSGHVYWVGTLLGRSYIQEPYSGFESFLQSVVEGGRTRPLLTIESSHPSRIHWRSGMSGNARLLFVINEGPEQSIRAVLSAEVAPASSATDLISGELVHMSDLELRFSVAAEGTRILSWNVASEAP